LGAGQRGGRLLGLKKGLLKQYLDGRLLRKEKRAYARLVQDENRGR